MSTHRLLPLSLVFTLGYTALTAPCGYTGTTPPPRPPEVSEAGLPSVAEDNKDAAAKVKEITIDTTSLNPKIPLTGYAPPEISLQDDATFFAALNLDLPGLEATKAAVASGDYAKAKSELASYFRKRSEPVLVREGATITPISPDRELTQKRLAAASMPEQAMKRDYRIAGISYKFEGPLAEMNWELNPTTQPGYKGAWSGQFHTQLNRMHYWRELAEAWRTTGNPEYRDQLVAQLRDWQGKIRPPTMADVPTFVQRYNAGGMNVREFRLWLPLDVGQRTANTTYVFEALRQDPAFDDETMINTLKMVGEHAHLLTQLHISGNHLAIATMGLANAAALFPEFKDAPAWVQEAVSRVAVEMSRQVYPDGAQTELTPWYHFTALRNFSNVLEVVTKNGYSIPQTLLEGLRKMYDYIAKISDPLGAAPPMNNAELLRSTSIGNAKIFFPEDPVYNWFATEGAEGTAPDFLSLTVPFAGQAVMRTGWDKNAKFFLMEYGPFGTGHMHEDKLGFSITANGRRLVIDPGRNKYEASTMRDYSVNAAAHSTVLFDGLFQARRLAQKALNAVTEPVPVIWQSSDSADYVVGSYGANELEKFALPTDPPGNVSPEWFKLVLDEKWREDDVQVTRRMVQHRHVLFVKPYYWVIVDTFDPLDEASHNYTSLFQLADGAAEIKDRTVVFGKPGEAGMALALSTPTNDGAVSIVRGQKEPFFLGWSFADGEPSPSPTVVFQHAASGPCAAATVIVPHAAGAGAASPAVAWNKGENGAYILQVDPSSGMPPVTVTIPADGTAGSWEIAPRPATPVE